MRITNNMITNGFLKNLNTNLSSLTGYQQEVSTGRSLTSISDDPSRLISSMQARSRLGKISQYQSTLNAAVTWLDQTDSSLSQLNDVLTKAYETAVQASNDVLTQDERKSLAEYIAQLRDQVLTIANNQSSDKYIFGGYNVNKQPFTVDEDGNILYNGLDLTDDTNPELIAMGSQSIGYQVGYNTVLGVSVTGTELLGTGKDNIYTVLDDLYKTLSGGAGGPDIDGYITKIQRCQSRVHTVQGRIGGLTNRLEMLQEIYAQQSNTYTKQKSEAEDADIAEVYTKYSAARTVYDAALQVGTQILQCSILDYLK